MLSVLRRLHGDKVQRLVTYNLHLPWTVVKTLQTMKQQPSDVHMHMANYEVVAVVVCLLTHFVHNKS